jgi:hypothetical protein
MAQRQSNSGSMSRAEEEIELWFNSPSHTRCQQEPSAYQATSNRLSINSASSTSSRIHMVVPTISTTADLNKPLPPVSAQEEKRSRKPTTLRSFLRSRSTAQLDPSHLQPIPYTQHQRHSSADSNLTLDTYGHYRQQFSRSMPSSPAYDPTIAPRGLTPTWVQPAADDYVDASHYQPYSVPLDYFGTNISLNTQVHDNLDLPPARVRTFPEVNVSSPTARQNASSRPRPHTWLSPTEPFSDPSHIQLFVEATTGLPDDADPWSPNGPNRLQGSLFARRSPNENVAPQQQYIPAPIPDQRHQTASWQSFEPPLPSPRSVSAPMSGRPYEDTHTPSLQLTRQMHAINAELEMLGLDGDNAPDEELPDYAQSQAEMHAQKRQEAAARARELEARWRGARRERGRAR